jgi:C-terminal peptidase prc
MFRNLTKSLVAIIALFTVANPIWAGTTHAIIVGVGQFADAQIQPRKFAEADAQALYDVIVDKDRLGAPAENVRLFLPREDDKRNAKPATKDNILAAVKDVVAKAAKDDLVIVAMFGRGAVLADSSCFFTADATFKDRAKSALAAADLEHEFHAFKGDKLVAFIDVNYKGIDPGEEKLLEPRPSDLLRVFIGGDDKEKDKEKEKDELTVPLGRVVFLGNVNITPAIDLEEHGLFAQVILDGLKGKADKDGYEPDGNITVDELDAYVDANLMPLARTYGKTNEEKLQQLFVWGGHLNTFVLTHNPAVMPKVKERLAKLVELKLPADKAAEGEKLLAKMPRLKADQDLRKLYQQLVDGALTNEKFETARNVNFESRKLSLEETQQFAKKTMDGLLIVRSGYVKDVELSQLAAWAVKGLYRRLDEKMPNEIKEKLDTIKDLRRARLEELLADVRQRFGKREDLEGNKDVDLAISQMMLNLDYPYTTYIDSETKMKAKTEFLGRFTGIGIQIRRDIVRDGLLVVSPIKGSPAYKAGLLAGDLITEVITDMSAQGKPMKEMETVSTRGMKTEDAIKRILGDPNTKITVKVEREGSPQPILVDINRAQVNVETVMGVKRMDDDEWEFMLDPKDKIGYIRLTQFTDKSAGDMEAAVKKLARAGVKGLVLDLRFNPGGLLDSAVEISDLFIDDGLIVSIRPRAGRERAYGGTHEGSYLNFPMVCLVNGASASGSEIVAAALQDHQRAVIIGERSFGKGSVQTIHQFRPTDAEIKMTTATFWRPNGKNLNKPSTNGSESEDWGVRPDAGYEIKLDRKEASDLFERIRDQEIIPRRDIAVKEKPAFVDRQLDKGLEYLRSQLRTASAAPVKKAG